MEKLRQERINQFWVKVGRRQGDHGIMGGQFFKDETTYTLSSNYEKRRKGKNRLAPQASTNCPTSLLPFAAYPSRIVPLGKCWEDNRCPCRTRWLTPICPRLTMGAMVPNSPTGQVVEAGPGWPVLVMAMTGPD